MRTLSLMLLVIAASANAQAQAFSNLNFEAATVGPTTPDGISFLDWNLAVPGWSHSQGADTSIVYYGGTHVGQTQWFLLLDAANGSNGVLAGSYSLSFASGLSSSNSPGAPWVNAFVSQTGMVPANAQSLNLLANGPLGFSMNGVDIPLLSLGGSAYAADISSFAGMNVEMKFINTATQQFQAVTLDNVAFSTSPVPELPVWMLLSLAAASIPLVRRRKVAR